MPRKILLREGKCPPFLMQSKIDIPAERCAIDKGTILISVIRVAGLPCLALNDTGAGCSIISTGALDRILALYDQANIARPEILPSDMNILPLGVNSQGSTGKVILPLWWSACNLYNMGILPAHKIYNHKNHIIYYDNYSSNNDINTTSFINSFDYKNVYTCVTSPMRLSDTKNLSNDKCDSPMWLIRPTSQPTSSPYKFINMYDESCVLNHAYISSVRLYGNVKPVCSQNSLIRSIYQCRNYGALTTFHQRQTLGRKVGYPTNVREISFKDLTPSYGDNVDLNMFMSRKDSKHCNTSCVQKIDVHVDTSVVKEDAIRSLKQIYIGEREGMHYGHVFGSFEILELKYDMILSESFHRHWKASADLKNNVISHEAPIAAKLPIFSLSGNIISETVAAHDFRRVIPNTDIRCKGHSHSSMMINLSRFSDNEYILLKRIVPSRCSEGQIRKWLQLKRELIRSARRMRRRLLSHKRVEIFINVLLTKKKPTFKINVSKLSLDSMIKYVHWKSSPINAIHTQSKTIIGFDEVAMKLEEESEPYQRPTNILDIIVNKETKTFTSVNPDLQKQERSKLEEILKNAKPLQDGALAYLPLSTKSMISFDTGDTKPESVSQYKISPPAMAKLNKMIDEMLEAGIIIPGKSKWNSPLVLIPKPDNTLRLCIDYSKTLNKHLIKDPYKLPTIDETLQELQGAKFFSKIDLKQGYWQVLLNPADQHKTAFCVPGRGQFFFCRCPMGCVPASAEFQRIVDEIIGSAKFANNGEKPFAKAYQDDIIVFSDSFDKHLEHLRFILSRLEKYNMSLKGSKCSFAYQELHILGHVVNQHGILPDPERVESIAAIQQPKDVSTLRSFMGMVNFYGRYIPNLSHIAAPLNILLKKDTPFSFARRQQAAFKNVKKALMKQTLLNHPDWNRPFRIQTDSSDFAVGATLVQRYKVPEGTLIDEKTARENNFTQVDGIWYEDKPIAFASKSLNKTQRNWPAREREAFAVVWAVTDKFDDYIRYSKFDVDCDHKSLSFLWTEGRQKKLVRWATLLNQYHGMTINYIKGEHNIPADVMSRIPIRQKGHEKIDAPINAFGCVQLNNLTTALPDIPGVSPGKSNIEDLRPDNEVYRFASSKVTEGPSKLSLNMIKMVPSLITLVNNNNKRTRCINTSSILDKTYNDIFTKFNVEMYHSHNESPVIKYSIALLKEFDWIIVDGNTISDDPEWYHKIKQAGLSVLLMISNKSKSQLDTIHEHFRKYRKASLHSDVTGDGTIHFISWGPANNTHLQVKYRSAPHILEHALLHRHDLARSSSAVVNATTVNPESEGISEVPLDYSENEGPELKQWREAQLLVPAWAELIEYFKDLEHRGIQEDPSNQMHAKAQFFTYKHGLLYTLRKRSHRPDGHSYPLLLVPPDFRKELIRRHHEHLWSGHHDYHRTYMRLARKYWWRKMKSHVEQYVKQCGPCKKNSSLRPMKAGVDLFRNLWEPFFEIGIDIFSGLPTTSEGYCKILTVIDTFSRWVLFIPLKEDSAKTIAYELVTKVFTVYGLPIRICSDRGRNLNLASINKQICALLGIKAGITAAYHPQGNGATERVHRPLLKALRIRAEKCHTNWVKMLPYIAFSLRTAISAAYGYSPFELMFGRHPRLPTDILTAPPTELGNRLDDIDPFVRSLVKNMRDMHGLVTAQRSSDIDKRIAAAEERIQRTFSPGDYVLLFSTPESRRKPGVSRKLLSPAKNCFVVISQKSKYTYELQNTRTGISTVAHVDRMLLDLSTPYERRLRDELGNGEWTGLASDSEGKSVQSAIDDLMEKVALYDANDSGDEKLPHDSKESVNSREKKKVTSNNSRSSIRTIRNRPNMNDEKVIPDDQYDGLDPYSKVFRVGDLIIFDDVDGKKQWNIGEVTQVDEDTVELQYYDHEKFRTHKNPNRIYLKPAWHDSKDGKDSYAPNKPKPHMEPYLTTISVDEVFFRIGNVESLFPNGAKKMIKLTTGQLRLFKRIRGERHAVQQPRSKRSDG